jgi:hypothetical protein
MKRKELRLLDKQLAPAADYEKDFNPDYEQEKRRLKKEKLQRRRIRRAEEYGLSENSSR